MTLSGIISSFLLLSQSRRQVPYALLTRPPWLPWCKHHFPIDLHVLSILSAFILSQDQTLHCHICVFVCFCFSRSDADYYPLDNSIYQVVHLGFFFSLGLFVFLFDRVYVLVERRFRQ